MLCASSTDFHTTSLIDVIWTISVITQRPMSTTTSVVDDTAYYSTGAPAWMWTIVADGRKFSAYVIGAVVRISHYCNWIKDRVLKQRQSTKTCRWSILELCKCANVGLYEVIFEIWKHKICFASCLADNNDNCNSDVIIRWLICIRVIETLIKYSGYLLLRSRPRSWQ